MGPNAFARFTETCRWLVRRRILIGFVALLLLGPTGLTHFFFWRIEHRLHLKINGKPLFTWVPGFVRLKGNFLEWENRLWVRSGSLDIRFPISILFRKQYPISLEGKNLTVEFGPGFQEALGGHELTFERVATRLLINSKGGLEIDFLDAESKTIQFHLSGQPKQGSALTGEGG